MSRRGGRMVPCSGELLHQGVDGSTTLLLVPDGGEKLSGFRCEHVCGNLAYPQEMDVALKNDKMLN